MRVKADATKAQKLDSQVANLGHIVCRIGNTPNASFDWIARLAKMLDDEKSIEEIVAATKGIKQKEYRKNGGVSKRTKKTLRTLAKLSEGDMNLAYFELHRLFGTHDRIF